MASVSVLGIQSEAGRGSGYRRRDSPMSWGIAFRGDMLHCVSRATRRPPCVFVGWRRAFCPGNVVKQTGYHVSSTRSRRFDLIHLEGGSCQLYHCNPHVTEGFIGKPEINWTVRTGQQTANKSFTVRKTDDDQQHIIKLFSSRIAGQWPFWQHFNLSKTFFSVTINSICITCISSKVFDKMYCRDFVQKRIHWTYLA